VRIGEELSGTSNGFKQHSSIGEQIPWPNEVSELDEGSIPLFISQRNRIPILNTKYPSTKYPIAATHSRMYT
jgi:hypothetical protein